MTIPLLAITGVFRGYLLLLLRGSDEFLAVSESAFGLNVSWRPHQATGHCCGAILAARVPSQKVFLLGVERNSFP